MAKGMILAAGQGTRVRPLTSQLPKPMVPILGKPVMEYLIEHLARYGVTEIMVNGITLAGGGAMLLGLDRRLPAEVLLVGADSLVDPGNFHGDLGYT